MPRDTLIKLCACAAWCVISNIAFANPPRIVLIAGPADDHARGTHEYAADVRLLKHCLDTSPDLRGIRTEAHFNGWPEDPAALDDAATIFLASAGSDRHETDHPFHGAGRFAQIEKQMQRGCGLVLLHWSTFHPSRVHDQITEWVGGYFDYIDIPRDGTASTLDGFGADENAGARAKPAILPPNEKLEEEDAGAKETNWADSRWQQMDVGRFIASILPVGGDHVLKGISIRAGPRDEAAVCFDSGQVNWRAAWTGGFIEFDPARFGLIKSPRIEGELMFSAPADAGWSGAAVRYRGLSSNGRRVVLHYSVDDMLVLESPWAESTASALAITRTLELGASTVPRELHLLQENDATPQQHQVDGISILALEKDGQSIAAAMARGSAGTLSFRGNERMAVSFPARTAAQQGKVLFWRGPSNQIEDFAALVNASAGPEDLAALTRPGERRWPETLRVQGHVSNATEAYVIDTIPVPYENPYKALMFLSGVDFFDNGDAAVCSIHGDVWIVGGIDDALQGVTWQRFATGLFQPLGLRIVNNKVHVLGRDQITVLHDQNNDGEADYYENFCNQIKTSPGHDYVTSLEIPGLQPVMQMRIKYDVDAADGAPVFGEVFNTIHRLGPTWDPL